MSTLAGHYGLIFPTFYMVLIFGLSSIPGSEHPETAIGLFFLSVPVDVQNFSIYRFLAVSALSGVLRWKIKSKARAGAQCLALR